MAERDDLETLRQLAIAEELKHYRKAAEAFAVAERKMRVQAKLLADLGVDTNGNEVKNG